MKSNEPIAPGGVIGILGGGQLGRMLSLAAAPLGLRTAVLCPDPNAPAFDVCAHRIVGDYTDVDALDALAAHCEVVTYEFENVPVSAIDRLSTQVPVRPGRRALAITQERFEEKSFLSAAGIPVAPYACIDAEADVSSALKAVGLPAIIKTRRFGYDGKGQRLVRTADEAFAAFRDLRSAPCIAEGFVKFDRELSIIAARTPDGTCATWDISENIHENHVLRRSRVPVPEAIPQAKHAQTLAQTILQALDYVGVIGIELFDTPDGLLVNELAPRVHNSGHWTADACVTGQFEQHVRAISGWALGETTRHSDAIMTNLLGEEVDAWDSLATTSRTKIHLYGKRDRRPGRKMGHITRL
ncbi:MAG: 5-(carboxyamino)imidazole ribonucleotide synthase, partial [Myxococcota bacterium]|nr:5-(carboxyamino)imidazole ribonucleotide synthase [Myxococcota bacterium]